MWGSEHQLSIIISIGMDQRSDFVSDFRARRIRKQITWENLSANCHEVTVTYLNQFRLMRIAGSGTASAGASNGKDGE